jgi:YbgC/YbaW family acyl-CoA thioester hydrolase
MTTRIPIEFVTRHRPRFAELDPNGHVNAQHFLGYFLEHRLIAMREVLGLDMRALAKFPATPVVRKVEIEYLKPIFLDDEFEIRSQVVEFRDRSSTVSLSMSRPSGDVLSTCRVDFVCVDRKTGQPCEWPPEVIRLFYRTE